MQIGKRTDCSEIEVFTVNKGTNDIVNVFLLDIEVFFGGKYRSADDTAFKPCKALPIASLRHQVLFEHVAGTHDRTGVSVRAQTHIHAEHEAFPSNFR